MKATLPTAELDAQYAAELPDRETLSFLAVYVLNGVTITKSFNDLVDAQIACVQAINVLGAQSCKVLQAS